MKKKILFIALILFSFDSYAEKQKSGYLIDKKAGCKIFTEDINEKNIYTVIWNGDCKNGYAEGQGSGTYFENGKLFLNFTVYFANGMADGDGKYEWANGSKYIGQFKDNKFNGHGTLVLPNGDKYIGEFQNDSFKGQGTYYFLADNDYRGSKYIGEFRGNKKQGKGIYTAANGSKLEGIWENDKFVHAEKLNLTNVNNQISSVDLASIELERKQLAEDRSKLEIERNKIEAERRNKENVKNIQKINLQVTNTEPNNDGEFIVNVKTNVETVSLKLNNEEFGSSSDGNYIIKRVALVGKETQLKIVAKDANGYKAEADITLSRKIKDSSQIKYAELNPSKIIKQVERDAVAIIIGISEYKNLPKADFANDDARNFYDYAIRALGVKPENIRLLVDSEAGQGEILKTFKSWLPARVNQNTDIYIYYSGHGLPSVDGQTLYLLPQQADRDLIEDTAVAQSRINSAIQLTKPKSVTIFLDSCYSGAARTGEQLLVSARPISLKANTKTFPPEFTVFTASTADQISSSSPELKHGIFSYYLMRGMEGEADKNKDGKITTGELQDYLLDNVMKQASIMNRVQQPQLTGDINKVFIGR